MLNLNGEGEVKKKNFIKELGGYYSHISVRLRPLKEPSNFGPAVGLPITCVPSTIAL